MSIVQITHFGINTNFFYGIRLFSLYFICLKVLGLYEQFYVAVINDVTFPTVILVLNIMYWLDIGLIGARSMRPCFHFFKGACMAIDGVGTTTHTTLESPDRIF